MNGAPTVEVGGRTFCYAELTFGTGAGNRGIKIWEDGVQGTDHEYKFSPNPHGNKKYNKHTAAFYREMALAIAGDVVAGAWPPFFTTTYTNVTIGEDITLVPR